MYNKISTINPVYNRLRLCTALLFLCAVILAIILIAVSVINSNNLNGKTYEVSGVVTFAGKKDGNYVIEMDNFRYAADTIDGFVENWEHLNGKTITLIIPQNQHDSANKWVLGIKADDKVIVDFNEVTQSKLHKSNIVCIVFGVLVGVLVLTSGIIYYFQKKTAPTVEHDIGNAYFEYMFARQPAGPHYRKMRIATIAFVIAFALGSVALALVETLVADKTITIVVEITLAALLASFFAIYLILQLFWLPQKEKEYYSNHFPFDLDDISHVFLRKKIKKELQAELRAEREQYPDRFFDGGNELIADFCTDGVSLASADSTAPSAQEVFGEGGDVPTDGYVCTLSYDLLNFEAVPYYRPFDRPMTVIIKSRLNAEEATELKNDVYILFDINLLKTLRKYNVPVENLDFILENKLRLMKENCKIKRKK